MRLARVTCVLLFLAGCGADAPGPPAPPPALWVLPSLPSPVANNAVTVVTTKSGPALVSFLGLGPGKTHNDIVNTAFVLDPGASAWRALPAAPGPGRLAATAAAVGEDVFLFGGYTVAADGSEKSIETVHALNLSTETYAQWQAMPVPVDDAVSAVYQDRYVYLVSGWHDTGNVNLVQVLDTKERRWFQATPFPGTPVFGHAGGIAGRDMIVCDGVQIVTTTGRREFATGKACYRGQIDADNPAKIDWTVLPPHPGPALYRMAAVGDGTRVLFAGGSDNPYNYNGVGYDGVPSAPAASVFAFDVTRGAWQTLSRLVEPSMDHRGLLPLGGGRFALVGGMRARQRVVADVVVLSPD